MEFIIKNCDECPFNAKEWYQCMLVEYNSVEIYSDKRPDFCPLNKGDIIVKPFIETLKLK